MPLTVMQSLPLDGVIIVTSPQELVSMVVEKAVKMTEKMKLPIVGLVENMSYFECPDCGKRLHIFGEGKTERAAESHGLRLAGCRLTRAFRKRATGAKSRASRATG